jgi:hypothetical protein
MGQAVAASGLAADPVHEQVPFRTRARPLTSHPLHPPRRPAGSCTRGTRCAIAPRRRDATAHRVPCHAASASAGRPGVISAVEPGDGGHATWLTCRSGLRPAGSHMTAGWVRCRGVRCICAGQNDTAGHASHEDQHRLSGIEPYPAPPMHSSLVSHRPDGVNAACY